MQRQPTKLEIDNAVFTKASEDQFPPPLKLHAADYMLKGRTRTIPKFWVVVNTRETVREAYYDRTWREWVAGMPKRAVKAVTASGRQYLPVFATSVEMNDDKGKINFGLTSLERDEVGIDFEPVALLMSLGGKSWTAPLDNVGFIDGHVAETLTLNYTFAV